MNTSDLRTLQSLTADVTSLQYKKHIYYYHLKMKHFKLDVFRHGPFRDMVRGPVGHSDPESCVSERFCGGL